MKLAIIADGHLFQGFMKNYDPLRDLKTIMQKISKENAPDMLLMAGDMFDFKKTATAYLRHYEGEGLMISIRNIFQSFGVPVYVIRGNHEKEEVLRSLDQTVENFHYVKNDWREFNGVSIYFMDTHFEGELYEPEVVAQIIRQITSASVKADKTKILLCHETFAPYENSLPKKVIEDVKKIFDWIVNGHMHFWNPSAYGLKNVMTLSSVLPSRVILGKYWIEQYTWQCTDEKPKFEKRDSPFGYTIVDTEKKQVKLHHFTPSRKTVEISVETTNLTLKEVMARFREVLRVIKGREDKDSLVILPEIHGDASFITTFVKDVFKDYAELSIEELRINTTSKIITASGKVISPPLLTPEQLFEDVAGEFQEIRKKLMEELEADIEINILRKILRNIRENELLEKIPSRTTTRLENLLEEIISQLKDIKKTETFEDDFKSIIKRVKE
ncbi:MAG: metallophosphoesterase [Candidatus Bathyarchaeota archaeon]|nr:metallophosphoesterase [Candidatus Bathyarchaeota archaeon]